MLPDWMVQFRYWDILLMSVTASQILYAYVGSHKTLNKQYYRFLVEHGAKDKIVLHTIEDDFRCQPHQWEALAGIRTESP
jgi:hypothetical protein